MVYSVLNCENILQGHVDSVKRINLLTQHNHVKAKLTGVMAKRYVCEGCDKGCKYGAVHTCKQTCRDCVLIPPCISAGPRIPLTYVTDTLEIRHSSITTKRKRKVQVRRAHVSFVIVVLRSAL